jgi:hypothetical protein
MEHTALGELTENPGHAWPRVRPNTQLLLAYKRRVRGPIWRRRIRVEKPYPIAHLIQRYRAKRLEDI